MSKGSLPSHNWVYYGSVTPKKEEIFVCKRCGERSLKPDFVESRCRGRRGEWHWREEDK